MHFFCTYYTYNDKTNNALPNESALCYPYSLSLGEGRGEVYLIRLFYTSKVGTFDARVRALTPQNVHRTFRGALFTLHPLRLLELLRDERLGRGRGCRTRSSCRHGHRT